MRVMQWRWVTGWRRVLGAVALAGLAGCSVAPPVLPVPPGATDAVPVADTRSSLPPYWYTGAFIEVFVRSYQDSDGDGIGDLKGLTSRLDYLRDLGVRGIWLMPVTRSADHDHGYAVTDYRAIERDYGSLQDFDEFIRQAHARGIGVIMDYVLNHSAAQHPFFTQSRSSASNPFHDWYVWQPTMPLGWDVWGKNPWTMTPVGAFYATFGPHMPDFNLRNPRVVAYHDDSLRFWLNRGLDGFRFDAVPHLIENGPQAWNDQPESHALMAQVRALVNRYDNRYIVCEATANPVSWSQPQSCGSAFAFEHERDVIRAAKGDLSALPVLAAFFRTRPLTMATMLTNHDSFVGDRLWNQFAGDLSAYRLAAATYLLQPGIPFIYYGEEIGMADGQLAGDARLRTPMSWAGDARTAGFTTGQPYRGLSVNVATHNAAAEQRDPQSLLAWYRTLLAVRNTYASVARGSYEHAQVDGAVLSWQRHLGNEVTVTAIHYGSQAQPLTLHHLAAGESLRAVLPADAAAVPVGPQGDATVMMAPRSVRVWVVQRP